MKLVTAISTAALVLAPVVGLAQAPANGAGDTQEEPSLKSKVQRMIGVGSPDTKEGTDAKSGAAAQNAGDTNYPDRGAVKRTDK
jgi:hypothetical protein